MVSTMNGVDASDGNVIHAANARGSIFREPITVRVGHSWADESSTLVLVVNVGWKDDTALARGIGFWPDS